MIPRDQLMQFGQNLTGLGTKRLVALSVVGLLVVALVIGSAYFLSRPPKETLYTGLAQQDIARIGAALGDLNITFDVDQQGGAVLVPYGQASRARMLLAEQGLPSASSGGYELFDQLGSMGLTSFMQEVTRVRALEGEMARTIQTMKGVKAARVHIVMADAGSFRRQSRPATASVVIRTDLPGEFPGAAAIRHLIAAAVPELAIDRVSILNTNGAVLAAAGDPNSMVPGKMLSLEQTVSERLQQNVNTTLAPYLGVGNFQVSVAATVNTDKRQTKETTYDPDKRVERSTHIIKRAESSENRTATGAVGVEQNIPEEEPAGSDADRSASKDERREEVTNFEISSRTTNTVSEGYRVEKLTVAVVVNRAQLLEEGQVATPATMDARLKEIEGLVAAATGIDANRGDVVTVSAVDFQGQADALAPIPGISFVEHLMRNMGTVINGAAAVLIAWLVIWYGVRPMATSMREAAEASAINGGSLAAAGGGSIAGQDGLDALLSADSGLVEDYQRRNENSPQSRLQRIIDMDESQAAAVLKQWMQDGN